MAKIDESLEKLSTYRQVRNRSPGDGGGPDIGIAPGGYAVSIAPVIDKLPAETRAKLLEHVSRHVNEAMKPLIRLMERSGCSDHALAVFKDVGPNALRTVIEHLESDRKD